MSAMDIDPGDALTLADRLMLEPAGPGRWRSLHGDANQNGRSYGGQLLGQALRAALMEAPEGRPPTMMQFLFLQGAMPDQPIVFDVQRLQDGKRFTSLQVRGAQGERTVLDAQVSCALNLPGPAHAEASSAPEGERPDELPSLGEVPEALRERIALMGGYGRDCNAAIDFRVPEATRQLDGATAGGPFRYWMKVPEALPEDAHLHAAAFAYLSDWWLNFCILAPHLARAGERGMYISSLNHALWLHAPPRADRWLHVRASCAHAAHGRGLAIAQYHDEGGRHIATATQDCLVTYTD
jgi:acyl-CoA thioesterase II